MALTNCCRSVTLVAVNRKGISMDLNQLQATLRQDMRVKLLENGQEVATGTITLLLPGELEFTDGDPQYKGFKKEFAYKSEWRSWKKLHEDPFTRGRCTSEFGAIYFFVPIEDAELAPAAGASTRA